MTTPVYFAEDDLSEAFANAAAERRAGNLGGAPHGLIESWSIVQVESAAIFSLLCDLRDGPTGATQAEVNACAIALYRRAAALNRIGFLSDTMEAFGRAEGVCRLCAKRVDYGLPSADALRACSRGDSPSRLFHHACAPKAARREERAAHPRANGKRQIKIIGDRDCWICWLCEKPVRPDATGLFKPTRDHVIPRSLGGSNGLANLRLAHMRCNSIRSSDPPEVAREKLRMVA